MHRKRNGIALIGVLALALSVTVGLMAGGVANAKKKKSKVGGTVDITKSVFAPIPDAVGAVDGVLTSTIDVGGKKFRGTKIRDVNVMFQTTATSGASPADNLIVLLSAPNGATTYLIFGLTGLSIGPLTLDDETFIMLGGAPPAPNLATLVSPYAGTAQPQSFGIGGACLCLMDNGAVTGTWTLRVIDAVPVETSILNQWKLTVVAGKAFQTK